MLDQALAGLPRVTNPNVLVGYETSDDAGVYRLHTLQVFTVDRGRVAHNVVFADPAVLALFDLPAAQPAARASDGRP